MLQFGAVAGVLEGDVYAGFEQAEGGAAVMAAALQHAGVYGLVFQQQGNPIGELYFALGPGWGASQGFEYPGHEDVAAHDGEVGGGLFRQ